VRAAKENVDGLVLCERHALEAKLEGQITCWEAMLAHIDLWSREVARRNRPDIVRLLEVERLEANLARGRAAVDLHLARGCVESLLHSVCVLDKWLEDNEGKIEDEERVRRVEHLREEAVELLKLTL
jgi:hypothetical protein